MTKEYIEETKRHLDDPIIKKCLKQIKINKIMWLVGAILGLILTVVMAIVGFVVQNNWQQNAKIIAVVIPAVVTALLIVMTVFIWIGNEVCVKKYKTDEIIFYSGPWSNALYINSELIYKGSSETKMHGVLCDKSICKVFMKTTSISINILPPGSDPITGAPKAKDEKPTQPNKTEVKSK